MTDEIKIIVDFEHPDLNEPIKTGSVMQKEVFESTKVDALKIMMDQILHDIRTQLKEKNIIK
jgi:hypothetical protein